MGLERSIGLDSWWGLRVAHLKGAPKVGPTRDHLGAPTRAIKGGEGGGGAPICAALTTPQLAPSFLSLLLLLPHIKPKFVLADLAIRRAKLLPVRVDFVEVLCLLYKEEPFVRKVHATALPASICTTPTRYRSFASARLVVIL